MLRWVGAKEAARLRCCLLLWVQREVAALWRDAVGAGEGGCATAHLFAAVGASKGGCAAACCDRCGRRWLRLLSAAVGGADCLLLAAVEVQAEETACWVLRWGCWQRGAAGCLLRWECRRRRLLACCCGGSAGEGDCLLAVAVSVQAKETACCLLRWGCRRRRLLAGCLLW